MNWVKRSIAWAIPLLLIVAGTTYLVFAKEGYAITAPTVIAPVPTQVQNNTANHSGEVPISVEIPNVDLKLNILIGNFDVQDGQWAINNSDAFFAQGTQTPLLYGHNKPQIFGMLSELKRGDELTLTHRNGSKTRFTYDSTRFVKPDDPSVLNEKKPDTITLLTCSGLFNTERRIVYFEEIK